LISVANALVAEEMLGVVVVTEMVGMVLVGTPVLGVSGASAALADISERGEYAYLDKITIIERPGLAMRFPTLNLVSRSRLGHM
jgi:hypothetical protein